MTGSSLARMYSRTDEDTYSAWENEYFIASYCLSLVFQLLIFFCFGDGQQTNRTAFETFA